MNEPMVFEMAKATQKCTHEWMDEWLHRNALVYEL